MNTSPPVAYRGLRLATALLVLLLVASGCTDEADPTQTPARDESANQTESAATDTLGEATAAQSLMDVMEEQDRLNTIVKALDAANLTGTMQQQGPFTVFAPNDAAFDALPDGELDMLLQQNNRQQLTNQLTYHIVDGRLPASELQDSETLTTLSGEAIEVTVSGDQIRIGDATILRSNLRATNGIIHVIDRVLTTPDREP